MNNGHNSRDEDLALSLWQANHPMLQVPQGQLMQPVIKMEKLALFSRVAMNVGSATHNYAVMQMLMTAEYAERLKGLYQGDMPPRVEAAYQRLTDQFMAYIEAIPQQIYLQLLAELRRLSAELENETWTERLIRFLNQPVFRW